VGDLQHSTLFHRAIDIIAIGAACYFFAFFYNLLPQCFLLKIGQVVGSKLSSINLSHLLIKQNVRASFANSLQGSYRSFEKSNMENGKL
jgi:hypothetical protein